MGTYYDRENKVCVPCPTGTYQSESGQLQCSPCPVISGRVGVTVGVGARSAADCKGNKYFHKIRTDFLTFIYFQNVVPPVNISITLPDSVVVAAMVSINQTKVRSLVIFVVLVKQHVQVKRYLVRNVAMNANLVCNLLLKENANHARGELIGHKVFKRHVKDVR